mmetsp:Transcript_115027/g.358195  ORF Transcript_115027/g.358195 Transcript_115027/m.358195 type:complete len:220 (+) Transcript_115027:416-1075(+)
MPAAPALQHDGLEHGEGRQAQRPARARRRADGPGLHRLRHGEGGGRDRAGGGLPGPRGGARPVCSRQRRRGHEHVRVVLRRAELRRHLWPRLEQPGLVEGLQHLRRPRCERAAGAPLLLRLPGAGRDGPVERDRHRRTQRAAPPNALLLGANGEAGARLLAGGHSLHSGERRGAGCLPGRHLLRDPGLGVLAPGPALLALRGAGRPARPARVEHLGGLP